MIRLFISALIIISIFSTSFINEKNINKMSQKGFIEISVKDHLISHGFDENNKEIIEEVTVEKPTKKFLSVDRIQSVSAKYILTTYGHGRLVYWEYEGSYDELKEKILIASTPGPR